MEKMNLQIFAEEEQAAEAKAEGTTEQTEQTEENKAFSQQEVDRLISKIAEKWEKKADARIKEEVQEAQRLASMTAEEKQKHEMEKRLKEIEDMKKNMVVEQNRAECAKILAAENSKLAALADFAVAEDAETMKKNLDIITKTVTAVANDIVEQRLKGYTPKKDASLPAEIDKETFNQMSLDKQQQLYRENPELYKELTK